MVAEFDRRRMLLLTGLHSIPGVECVKPSGAFYVFPSIKKIGMSSDALALHLLHNAGVAVVPGSAFGENGEGFIRLAYSNSYKNIEKAIEKIRAALRN
jgi:aspartate/methionine/tyrosine aminotransferase